MSAPDWLVRLLQAAAFAGLMLWGNYLSDLAPQDGTQRGVKFWFILVALAAVFLIEKLLPRQRR